MARPIFGYKSRQQMEPLMSRILLIPWLIFPLSLSIDKLPPKKYHIPAFNALLITCLNGGEADIWANNQRLGYVSCKRIPVPKRYPK
jgi:hypothetical protein